MPKVISIAEEECDNTSIQSMIPVAPENLSRGEQIKHNIIITFMLFLNCLIA